MLTLDFGPRQMLVLALGTFLPKLEVVVSPSFSVELSLLIV